MDAKWREFSYISGAGGIGGMLSLVYSMTVGTPPLVDPLPWGVFAYAFLGAGAAFLGVYLIAKTDTNHVSHCLAFAVACGVAWAPVFDGTSALVQQNRERAATVKISKKIDSLKSSLGRLESANSTEISKVADAVVNDIDEIAAVASRVKDPLVHTKISKSVAQSIAAFENVKNKHPAVASNAIQEIRATQFASQNQPLFFVPEGILVYGGPKAASKKDERLP